MGLRLLGFGRSLFAAGVAVALSAGCAGKGASPTGTAGQTGTGARGGSSAAGTGGGAGATGSAGTTGSTGTAGTIGTSGAAGTTGSAGTTGATGTAGTSGAAGTTGAAGTGANDAGTDVVCQMAELKFEPKIPTVYLMVDRSGSMFDCLSTTNTAEPSCATPTDTAWDKLRVATESVVGTLQDQVRFGFAAFTGFNGGTCPMLSKVAPKVMNLNDIKTTYDGLPFPPNSTATGVKFESPASATIVQLGTELMNDPAPGDKVLLFVTDGEPDYCDDGTQLCAADSVIGAIQQLKTKGITTIVIGLQSAQFNLPAGILDGYANAGAGEPTKVTLPVAGDMNSLFDQCFPRAPWKADFLAVAPQCATNSNACRGMTVGIYAATAGSTKPYKPDASNQAMLVTQLSTAIAGVKSCTFDLSDVSGKSIKVDQTKLDQAKVLVMGTAVPHDATNGWTVDSTGKQLALVGTACASWRMPNVDTIDFQFPCSTIIFE